MYNTFQLKSCGAGLMGYHWEAADAAAVLCIIHGQGEYGEMYDHMAEEMVRNNISVLAMDLRGHGYSIGRRGHIGGRDTVLRDVDSLIALAARKYIHLPIIVYGHSLGGNILLDYRLNGSLATMPALYIAASPWLVLTRKYSPIMRGYVRLMSLMKPRHLFNIHVNKLVADKPIHNFISARTLLDRVEVTKRLLDIDSYDLKKQRKPLIIMHGSDDKICTIEGPNKISEIDREECTLIVWEGCGHELHNADTNTNSMVYFDKLAEIIKAR